MKKLFLLTLALILVFSIIACKGDKNSGSGTAQGQSANSTNNQSSSGPTAQDNEGQSWPTGEIYNVPEWKGITRYYGGGGSLDDYADRGSYSMSVIASEDSFNKYLETLERTGFEVSTFNSPQYGKGCSAEKGLVRLEISGRKFGTETGYQIDFEFLDIGSWPDYDLPNFLSPIKDKMLVDNPVIYKPGTDLKDVNGVWVDDTGYNYQFTYTGLTMAEAITYMKDVASKLTNGSYFNDSVLDYGGFGFIKGTCNWNGQRYYVYGEVVQQDRNTYDFYFGWSVEDMGW